MSWVDWLAIAAGVLFTALVALVVLGALRWSYASKALLAEWQAAREPLTCALYDEQEIADLPAPVKAYFRKALKHGQRIVAGASVEQSGSMNMKPGDRQWKPFRAHQQVSTHRPGFLWNASISLLPGIVVRVHDAYIAGVGTLKPSLLGLFPLAGKADAAALARAEFMRYCAEAAWYPTALLPSQGALWEVVNGDSAKVSFTDGDCRVSMLVRFNASSLIDSVRIEGRTATIGRSTVALPWEGRWQNYRRQDGMLIPFAGEACWLTPLGRQPYWRGTIERLTFEFAA